MIKFLKIAICGILLTGVVQPSLGQLRLKGTVYSESIVKASVKALGITDWMDVYFSPPKKIKNDGLIYIQTKYEIPWAIEKGTDHAIRFTDGLVEKMIFVSGAVPENINPRQKFIIDIDLVESHEPDMTLIVFWSIVSESYKAMPLSQLPQIIEEADPHFIWPGAEMNSPGTRIDTHYFIQN